MTYTKAVVKCLNDSEVVVGSRIPTIEAAEALQHHYLAVDTEGADYYIVDDDDLRPKQERGKMNSALDGGYLRD